MGSIVFFSWVISTSIGISTAFIGPSIKFRGMSVSFMVSECGVICVVDKELISENGSGDVFNVILDEDLILCGFADKFIVGLDSTVV